MKANTSLSFALRNGSAPLRSLAQRRRAPADPFYAAPDDLADHAPGELLRSERVRAYISPGVRMRARAWRVLYRSTSATGEPTAVSGTVLVPPSEFRRGPRPVVGYAIGTHGIGDGAAPSRLLQRGLDYEGGLIALTLARGWAVTVTDYEGLGTPGDHAYMVGRALGPNVLDSIRAARALHPAEFPAGGPAAVIGYSEGGAAAAWAGQLQPTYAPDVPLAGVAAGAAAANVEQAASILDGTFFSFFAAYGAIGYAAAYPELELEPYLTPRGRKAIPFLRESSIVGAALYGPHFARADELTDPNVLELPEWRARLRENRLGESAPAAPVLLHYARSDRIVAYHQGLDLRDDWRALGADVEFHTIRGAVDHISAGAIGTPTALRWLAARLRGESIEARRGADVVEITSRKAA